MYFEEAVKRINKIDWELFGKTVCTKEDLEIHRLGSRYLKNMALFFYEQHLHPRNPLVISVAELLGYKEKVDIKECCNPIIEEILKDNYYPKRIIEFHLQMAKLVDMEPKYERYLNIYEPMICLLELGFDFIYRDAGLMVHKVGCYPFYNWYKDFLELMGIKDV